MPAEGGQADARDAAAITLASYNVHRAVGNDGRRDPDRVAAVMAELGADLIAVQEAECAARRGGQALLERWAEDLGCTAVAGPTLDLGRVRYGNGLLSRLPVGRVRRHDLSVRQREPRGLLDVVVSAGQGELRVLVTHLGLAAGERFLQLGRLAEAIDAPLDGPVVLAGDLNAWWDAGRMARVLARAGLSGPRVPPAYPARWPWLALDRIAAGGGARLADLQVHRSRAARLASDHLPVTARVTLSAQSKA